MIAVRGRRVKSIIEDGDPHAGHALSAAEVAGFAEKKEREREENPSKF